MVTKTYTVAEFEQIIAGENDKRFELIAGEIIAKVPTQQHAYIVALLTAALVQYLKANPIGHALVEARYRIPGDEHNDRIPDLSFVDKDKGTLVKSGPAPYMPDLAVEVQSPGQNDSLMLEKVQYYLANGTRMFWLIYPDRAIAETLTSDSRTLHNAQGTLSGGDVLPEFSFSLADCFKDV